MILRQDPYNVARRSESLPRDGTLTSWKRASVRRVLKNSGASIGLTRCCLQIQRGEPSFLGSDKSPRP